jgi:phosphate transport system protein
MSRDVHRHFHDELSQVKVRLLTMSGEAEAALSQAVEALLERDSAKATQVIAGDRVIDAMEVEIEEQCIHLLALQQPMARDLRMLTSALKIANDLERVGDHAVNIAQSTERLLQSRPIAPEPEIVDMARLAREMLSDALEAFIRGDAAAGREVCRRDDQVDALHRSVFRILLTHMMEDPHTIGAGMELFLVSRNLERVADLATNIGEDVVFLVEGRSIKHHANACGESFPVRNPDVLHLSCLFQELFSSPEPPIAPVTSLATIHPGALHVPRREALHLG